MVLALRFFYNNLHPRNAIKISPEGNRELLHLTHPAAPSIETSIIVWGPDIPLHQMMST